VGDSLDRVMELLESGEPVPVELLALVQAESPDDYADAFGDLTPDQVAAELAGADGDLDAEPGATSTGQQGGTTSAQAEALVRELYAQTQSDDEFERSEALERLPDAVLSWQRVAGLEGGKVTLGDGTIITRADIDALSGDPFAQAQLIQQFQQAQAQIENDAAALLNRYNVDRYNMQRGQVSDANDRAIAQYNADIDSTKARLERDELGITQAAQAVDRALSGAEESRQRANLTTDTLMGAAPYGTSGGKTAFTGADLGAGVQTLLRQSGVADPATAEAIRFPGYITLDPDTLMQQGDAALGVAGPLPEIPGLSLSDADIPRAPALQGYGAIQMPDLAPPTTVPAITIPDDLLAQILGTTGATTPSVTPQPAPTVAPLSPAQRQALIEARVPSISDRYR